MTSSNTLLEPTAVIESQDVGSTTTIDRFDLESFTAHMINMDNNDNFIKNFLVLVILCQINNGIYLNQFFLVLSDAEPASIDRCHRSLILKFVDLLDGAGYLLQHSFIGAQSPSGRSRSFSADANGYARGGGLRVSLLKQLSDAERDGDSIEANCLDRFFNRSNLDPPLVLGSIKSNLEHTEGAAGVASLIKVAMCMYHRGITANIQFTSLNPKIDAQKYYLYILQNFIPFPSLPNNEKVVIGVN
ncbi:unnamed protein product [Adineta steineri]|uniref:Ketosynthase family 3 (KS3) domain-containing protein n=1 Tax=Adineta steineri TaxID=433720 RepID=A0A820EAM4_9BILA|nr:unnamed protein product [Adineta steineri]